MNSRFYLFITLYLPAKFRKVKRAITNIDTKEDMDTFFNIILDSCYIGNTLENSEKIVFLLLIVTTRLFAIIKNIKRLKFLKKYQVISFFLLAIATSLIFFVHYC